MPPTRLAYLFHLAAQAMFGLIGLTNGLEATIVFPESGVGAAVVSRPPADPPPEEVARRYLDAVESMRWQVVVAHVHPEAAASFRSYLEAILFHDPPRATVSDSPALRIDDGSFEVLTGVGSAEAFLEISDDEVLLQAFRALADDSPGLINAWIDRTTEVLGTVAEGDALSHVVYRTRWGLSGSTPDMEILTLGRVGDGTWSVLGSRELGSIRPALGSILRRVPATIPDGEEDRSVPE